jgi:hypothetical protein
MKGYKLVLRRLGDDKSEIAVTNHGVNGAPTYTARECEQIAHRFIGRGPWQLRRPQVWTNGDVVLGIYPFYPELKEETE